MNASLKAVDPEVFGIIRDEEERQKSCISLIASEVRAHEPVTTISACAEFRFATRTSSAWFCNVQQI